MNIYNVWIYIYVISVHNIYLFIFSSILQLVKCNIKILMQRDINQLARKRAVSCHSATKQSLFIKFKNRSKTDSRLKRFFHSQGNEFQNN